MFCVPESDPMALICNKKILLCHALRGLGSFTTRGNKSQYAHARIKLELPKILEKCNIFLSRYLYLDIGVVVNYIIDIVILLHETGWVDE